MSQETNTLAMDETTTITDTQTKLVVTDAQSDQKPQQTKTVKPKIDVQPVLEKLFELYPSLFGAKFCR